LSNIVFQEVLMVEGNELDIQKVVKALKTNRFETVVSVKDAETAVKTVLDMIPPEAMVGTGGSMTVNQLGLREILSEHGNIKPFIPGQTSPDEMGRARIDVFLTSSNSITLDGKLVNIDATGNRVSSQIFGPGKVIMVIGQNKIVSDADEAVKRVKYVIAPYHGMTMGINAPCAKTGKCSNCKSPGRICNITTIIEKKPRMTDIAIVLVAQDIGLGWDPEWPSERIESIKAAYKAQWERELAFFRRSRNP